MNKLNKQIGRVLVTDDEAHVRAPLVKALRYKNFAVEEAESGNHALNLLAKRPYDLMILDMHMPGLTGIDVMKTAKQLQPDVSIIVLTGHATVESAITAVKLHADDYFKKPSSVNKILSRVEEIVTNRQACQANLQAIRLMNEALELLKVSPTVWPRDEATAYPQVLTRGALMVDRNKHTAAFVHAPEDVIILSKGETAVLLSLMENANNVVSCQQIVRQVWQYDTDYLDAASVIRPYISRLRKKLQVIPDTSDLIVTVRNRGYMYKTPDNQDVLG